MNPRKLTWPGIAALLILLAIAAGISGLVTAREEPRPAKTAAVSTPVSTANDPALTRAIDQIIAGSGLSQARVGVMVLAAKDGRVLYAHDADRLFMPASNMKIYTTAVALDSLGPEYRWRTSVYAEKKPDG